MSGIVKVFLYLFLGEAAVVLAGLPVPGALIGLILMLLDFAARRGEDPAVAGLFDGVAPHLTLLFVPAGAGALAYLDLVSGNLVLVVTVIVAGTMATIVATAVLYRLAFGPATGADARAPVREVK